MKLQLSLHDRPVLFWRWPHVSNVPKTGKEAVQGIFKHADWTKIQALLKIIEEEEMSTKIWLNRQILEAVRSLRLGLHWDLAY